MSESQNRDAVPYWATLILLVLLLVWLVIGGQQFVLIVLPTLIVAVGCFSIWLTVRFINRRERWAKRKAAALIFNLVLWYPLSFLVLATICFWMEAPPSGTARELLLGIYGPLIWICENNRFFDWLFECMLTSPAGVAMVCAGALAAGIFAVRAATR